MNNRPIYLIENTDELLMIRFIVKSIEDLYKVHTDKKHIIYNEFFLEGFKNIKDKIDKIDFDKPEKEIIFDKILLDKNMCLTLATAICMTYEFLKSGIFIKFDKKLSLEDIHENNEHKEIFINTKEHVSVTLIKLVKLLGYPDFFLEILENVFEKKIAVRELKIDNIEPVISLPISEMISSLLIWVTTVVDGILLEHKKYKFAYNIINSQFINYKDYQYIINKLKNIKVGDNAIFTCYESVLLYLLLNLTGRFFLSNAVEYFELCTKNFTQNPDDAFDGKEIRDFYLEGGDKLMAKLKELLSSNKTFIEEIKRIETWPIDID